MNNEDRDKMLQDHILILSNLVIKTTALETVLLSKGIISSIDLETEAKKVSVSLLEAMKKEPMVDK